MVILLVDTWFVLHRTNVAVARMKAHWRITGLIYFESIANLKGYPSQREDTTDGHLRLSPSVRGLQINSSPLWSMSRHLDNVKFDILLLAITHCIYLIGMGREKTTLLYCVRSQWRLWEKIMYDFKICSDFNILRFNQPILLSFFIPSHALLVSCFSPSLFSICSFVSHTFSPSAVAQSQLSFLTFLHSLFTLLLLFFPFYQ